jgi:Zn-finger nucleic acid-binding protein
MHRCKSCSAPLRGVICDYCGSRNNVDLGHYKPLNIRPNQTRLCPVCHTSMSTIDVGEKVPFLIERCDSCYGLFFDKEELESMIDMTVKGGRNVNTKLLQELTENPRFVDIIVYRRCPVCRKHMNRKNYGGRSGVIMDECAEHGIWLDPGELRQIMEWVKAGGLKKQEKEEKRVASAPHRPLQRKTKQQARHYRDSSWGWGDSAGGFDWLRSILDV